MNKEYDWEHASQFIRTWLRRKLYGSRRHALEDLAQTALVRLIFATQRGNVENFEGLMVTIAHRTLIDSLRATSDLPIEIDIDAVPNDHRISPVIIDPLEPTAERLELILLELFDPECRELAIYKLDGVSWKELANIRGCSHAKIRQDWSRCSRFLRKRLREDASQDWGWA
ncbi:MAG: sigma-70 family RNA polymerase sigma factor [bacterium]|nr:sigma-70 family RNA polymerase sigma factor [bacterium]